MLLTLNKLWTYDYVTVDIEHILNQYLFYKTVSYKYVLKLACGLRDQLQVLYDKLISVLF